MQHKIIDEHLSKKEKQELTRLRAIVNSNYSHSVKYFEQRAKNWAIYKNAQLMEKAEWQADVRNPQPHLAAVRIASFLTDAVLGTATRPVFIARSWNNIEADEKALAYTRYMRYQQNKMKLANVYYQTFLAMCVEGTAFHHTCWKYDVVYHETTQSSIAYRTNKYGIQEPYIKETVVSEPVVYADQPMIEQVSSLDFFPDPAALDLETARHVVRRKYVPFSTLKELEKNGRLKNVDLLKDGATTIPVRSDSTYNFNPKKDQAISKNYHQLIKDYEKKNQDDPLIELMEVYEPGVVSIIGNGAVPLDIKRPVYRSRFPFVRYAYLPQYGEFFGMSLFEATSKIHAFSDEMLCMLIDNWKRHMTGTTLVGNGVSLLAEEQLKKGELGAVIKVQDPSDVVTIRPDLPNAQAVQGMQLLLQEAKEAMGIDGAMTGANPSSVRDSGSFEVFQRIQQVTLSVTVRRLTEDLAELGRQWHALNKQFLEDTIEFKIGNSLSRTTNNKVEQVNLAEIPMNLDFDIQISNLADSRTDKELKQMAELVNLIVNSGDPELKTKPLLLQMAMKIDSVDDPSDLLETDPYKIANNIAMKATAAGKQIPEIAGKYAPQTGSGNPALSPDQGGRPSNVEQQGDISQ
jgi:hypothetical protein